MAAYLSWGLLPLYFRALRGVPPLEILAHRVLWSVALLSLLLTLLGRWPQALAPLGSRRGRRTIAATTLLISGNWLAFIWAVQAGRVLEASLGYFINPLVNVLLGVLFLGESLSRRQRTAVVLAALGVAALVVRAGTVPWVALFLAATFGSYGLLRKRAGVDAVGGLLLETALLAPPALFYLGWLARGGAGHFPGTPRVTLLLAASGVITALPLIWFALGVARLRLSTIGLLQYIAPTLQFLLAVFLYGEPFSTAHALAFACIWASLALYTVDALASLRQREQEGAGAARARRLSATAGASGGG